MINLMFWGAMLVSTPQPIPEPKPERITFETSPSVYDRSWGSGTLTSYYNGKDKMNGETGIVASGYDLDNGIYYRGYRILAADRSIPLGTLIDIKTKDGEILHGIVLDRGGAIKGNHFDMVFRSYEECIKFGRQRVEWQIITK